MDPGGLREVQCPYCGEWIEIQIQPRLPAFNAAQHEVLDGIKAVGSHLQGVLDGGMQHILLIVFQQTQDLHILALACLALPRFQQALQC